MIVEQAAEVKNYIKAINAKDQKKQYKDINR